MSALTSIAVDQLRPNDYNPNVMTDDEFAELVAEVRHLGRVPKPIVVRANGAGFVVVDGEHGWRAAKEAGLESVPCEVVDVDDFEARRQTYKRNQHGTHNPVRLGQMFTAMMSDRSLSQRALAKEMEVSEGTIRNALDFAKAAAVRNDYAWQSLSVRQVRWYNRLPQVVADAWLKAGADCALIGFERGDPAHLDDPNCPDSSKWLVEAGIKEFQKLADAKLFELVKWGCGADGFKKALKTAREWAAWEGRFCYAGLGREEVRPYTKHYFNHEWVVREPDMAEAALRTIFDGTTKPPSFVLTPEEFEAALKEAHEAPSGESHTGFINRLELAVFQKTGTRPAKNIGTVEDQLAEIELTSAPDWVRAGALRPIECLAVWRAPGPDWKKRELLQERSLPDDFKVTLEQARKNDKLAQYLNAQTKESVATALAGLIGDSVKRANLPMNDLLHETLKANLSRLRKEEMIAVVDAFNWSRSLVAFGRGIRGETDLTLACAACGTMNRIKPSAEGAKCGNCHVALPSGAA